MHVRWARECFICSSASVSGELSMSEMSLNQGRRASATHWTEQQRAGMGCKQDRRWPQFKGSNKERLDEFFEASHVW